MHDMEKAVILMSCQYIFSIPIECVFECDSEAVSVFRGELKHSIVRGMGKKNQRQKKNERWLRMLQFRELLETFRGMLVT